MPLSREVPLSFLLHALVLTALVVLGGQVAKPMPQQRIMRVRLASLPRSQPALPQEAEPVSQPVETPAEKPPQREPVELEPKTLPEQPRERPEPRDPAPKPEVTEPVSEAVVAETSPDAVADAGPRVATGVDFPFVYYVDLIERRVSQRWHPPPLDSYHGRPRACVVEFVIGRSGAITRVSLAASSGVGFFDREALAAVKAASPLPPLPAKFPERELPVSIRFTLKPGY